MEGLTGAILIGPEATYDTEATTKVNQFGISSTIGPRRVPVRTRSRLTSYASATRQGPTFVDGEIVSGFSIVGSIIDNVLEMIGNDTSVAGTYVIGDGVQGVVSSSIAVDHGGKEYTYTGCVPQSFRLELGQEDAIYTLGVAGRTAAVEATVTGASEQAESSLFIPSDYGTLQINGDDYDFSSFTFEVTCPTDFQGKTSIGATQVRKAFLSGAFELSGSVTLEFDDDTTNDMDTVTLLADLLSAGDGDLGSITLGSWLTLSTCQATGDWPSLQAGAQEFTLNFNTPLAAIVTT